MANNIPTDFFRTHQDPWSVCSKDYSVVWIEAADFSKPNKNRTSFAFAESRSLTVTDVKVIVPNKVVEVTFADGKNEKAVCQEGDEFNLEHGVSICIMKHAIGSSTYNNAVNKAMKLYDKKLKKAAKDEEEKIALEKRIAKKKAKREARKALKLAQEREEIINIQKEAYLRAMKEFEAEK